MERELACEIVKDLLPLYVDGMVSDVSQRSVKEHLEHCEDCNEVYRNMTFRLEEEAQPPEAGEVKRFLKKTKQMYFLYGLGGLSFIALLVCGIVDLAINKGITWSLIAGSAVLFADALVYAVSVCKKNKALVTVGIISIGTFLLLFAIQIARYYLMHVGTFWILRYGLPILLLWLGVLWIPVLCRTFLKWNIWDCIALFLLLVIAGNYGTKLITGDYGWEEVVHMHNFVSNALGEVIGIVVFVIIGRVRGWKR
ncbi:zf-HC2 domain-containing protein [Lachnospiraceae bacterium 64-25]